MQTITFELEDGVFADVSKDGGVGAENETVKTAFLARCMPEISNRAEQKRKAEREADIRAYEKVRTEGTAEEIQVLKDAVLAQKAKVEARLEAEALANPAEEIKP